MDLRDQYNKSIMEASVRLDREGLKRMENFQYFDSTETGFTGILCGIIMRYIGDPSIPTIGMKEDEDKIKLSGRSTYKQLDRGVDLAVALRDSTRTVGGEGGGHSIASGGSIPLGTSEEFLKNLDTIIGGQFSSAM
jgi:RecJ-like exonuclease